MTKAITKKTAPPPAAGPKTDVLTALQKLDADQQKLTAARTTLLASAKTELLSRGQQLVKELGALGFHYRFTAVSSAKAKSPGAGKGPKPDAPSVCPICTWGTQPPHDRRAHRWQKNRGPFTEEELQRRGLVRI
jgi:hypothetical protein